MKKQLLSLVAALGLLTSANAQNYYSLKSTGVDNAGGYEYKQALVAGTTASVLAPIKDDVLSTEQTLPFGWTFFGQPVTKYVASDNGFISFNTTETTNPTTPVALPSTTAPKNAIFAYWYNFKLAQSGTGVPDQVSSWTYGTAPNRVHVIQWLSITTATGSFASFAIRIYEGKSFDVVLNQVGAALAGTIGVNNADGTIGYNIAGSPSVAWSTPSADGDYANMTKYRFLPGPQPNNEVELTSIELPKYLQKNTNVSIKGRVTNWGAQNLTSFKLNYAVGSGATLTMQLSGLDIATNGGTYDFTHNVPFSQSVSGDYPIKVWVSNPNASADGDSSNNNAAGNITVVNSTVPRKVMHEIFTSATCPPCNPGNANLKTVLDGNVGKWNVVKYQVNFPGTGDPYYTTEVGTRFSYYGANFAPWLVVDGTSKWGSTDANANSYTGAFFTNMQSIPSLASITANLVRVGQKVTVSGNVTPVQGFSNAGLKLRIAVVETRTTKNAKTNGETEFFNVMKKMLPDATGTAVNLAAGTAVNYTQSFTFPGTYRLPLDGQAANIINLSTENSVEEFGNLFAIVFLQDDNDKTVWQSASTAPDGALAVAEISELGLNLYPNPATSSFEVSFTGASSNGTVRIVDMNGKEVMNKNINSLNGTINCETLSNGLYFVELTVDGKTAVKKLNIIR